MKIVYCSNCGTRLNVLRKAMPKYGAVVNVVEYHECPDEVVELDLTPVDIPTFDPPKDKDQFVQKLNELNPLSQTNLLGGGELGDRRDKEHVKSDITSTAPGNLLTNMESMNPSTPAHETDEEPDDVA